MPGAGADGLGGGMGYGFCGEDLMALGRVRVGWVVGCMGDDLEGTGVVEDVGVREDED